MFKAIVNGLGRFINSNDQPISVADMGFKQESPEVQVLRERAKARMAEWGRLSLVEGGHFNLNNLCLKGQGKTSVVQQE